MSIVLCFLQEFPDVLECTVSHALEKINPDEREEMKVSGKLRPFQSLCCAVDKGT